MVGSNVGVAAKTAEVAKENLKNMGFNVQHAPGAAADDVHALLQHAVGEGRGLPERGLDQGLPDGQTMLDPTFNGKNILEQGNSNWPELDDPAINKAMDEAELAPAEDQRAAAWADDRQDGAPRPAAGRSRGSGTRPR